MLKPKTFELMNRCIEDGVRLGYARAHKHTDQPTEQHLKDCIENAVLLEICEWFRIEEDNGLQDDEFRL